jgi:hypothetical protein
MALQNPQIDYTPKTVDVLPSYKFSKIISQDGTDIVTIADVQPSTVFELPTRCMNLSRSNISFTATIPRSVTDGRYNRMFTSAVVPIRQIQLYTRSGVFLCDINNFDRYTNIVGIAETKRDDAIPNFIVGSADPSLVKNFLTVGGLSSNYQYDSAVKSQDYYEPCYAATADISDAAAGTGASIYNIQIPFSVFANTLLAIDKDLYFNEVILIKITWNDKNSWGIATATNTTMTGAPAVFTGVGISKLRLYLSLETNIMICAGLIQKVQMEGFQLIIPYVYQFKNALTASETHSVSVRLNRAHGINLKKIYHVLYPETSNDAAILEGRYFHSNANKTTIVSYGTTIDNVRRQEFDIVTANDEDYLIIKDVLKGTILESINTFRYNWFILDKFDDELHSNKSDTANTGLSLDIEHKWDLIATTSNNAWDHYTFAIVTRLLAITPEGVFVQ